MRRVETWQQRHPPLAFLVAVIKKFDDDQAGHQVALISYYSFVATFPLLLVLVTIAGVVLRNSPELQQQVVNSAFSQFPIVGAQLHQQLGVMAFRRTGLALTAGIGGALWGARGLTTAIQNTLNTLWAVPRVDRPSFPRNYLRALGLLTVLGLAVLVPASTAGISAAGAAVGLPGLPVRVLVFTVSTVVDAALFLAAFRLATAATVPTRAMARGAALSGFAWQVLWNIAGVLLAHTVRHAEAIAGLFGIVLGLMSWFALQATVTVYAIEADVVRARKLWPRSITTPRLTRADKRYLTWATAAEARVPEQRIEVEFPSPPHTPDDHSTPTPRDTIHP